MTTRERWLVFLIGVAAVLALSIDDFTLGQAERLEAAECGARGGMLACTVGIPPACIDSATLVALPPP